MTEGFLKEAHFFVFFACFSEVFLACGRVFGSRLISIELPLPSHVPPTLNSCCTLSRLKRGGGSLYGCKTQMQ